jgi:hypothetical protein
MEKLTEEQRRCVRNFLSSQGLTFGPLVEEMFDHVTSDIEERMKHGLSFEEAVNQMQLGIPENHLLNIQIETMETINRRFSVSRILSMIALALIFGGIVFKILHLPGASELLILSFAAMAGSFLSGTVSGIYYHREKKGAVRVLSIVAGTMLLMLGYTFRLMHWPGADGIVMLGVGLGILSLLFNTFHVYRHHSPQLNLLSYLHEKYTPGIERFFLILLVPTVILRIIMLPLPKNAFLGTVILVIIIYGAGLQYFATTWRQLEKNMEARNIANFSALVLSACCFSLVFLGEVLTMELRIILIMVFSIATAWLTFKIDPPKNLFMSAQLILVPAVFTVNAMIRLNLVPVENVSLVFNGVILLFLTAGVFVSTKHEATRAFLILSLASYVLEFSGKLI